MVRPQQMDPRSSSATTTSSKKTIAARIVAAATALALSFGAALAVAQPSNAADSNVQVTAGSSKWDIVSRWYSYILTSPPAPGTTSPTQSADVATSDNSYDQATEVLTTKLTDYTFDKPSHGISVKLTNVMATLDFKNKTGKIVADFAGTAAAVPTPKTNVTVATIDLSGKSFPTTSGDFSLTNLSTTIAPEVGSAVPAWGRYAGNQGSPLSLTFKVEESSETPGEPSTPSASAEPVVPSVSAEPTESAAPVAPSESADPTDSDEAEESASHAAAVKDDKAKLADTGASAGLLGVVAILLAAGTSLLIVRRRTSK